MKAAESNEGSSRERSSQAGSYDRHLRHLTSLASGAGEAASEHTHYLMEEAIPSIYEFIDHPEMMRQWLMGDVANCRAAQTVLATIRIKLLGRSELGDITPAYSKNGEWFAETYSLPLASGMVYQEEYNFDGPNDLRPTVEAVLLRPALLRPAPALSSEIFGPQ